MSFICICNYNRRQVKESCLKHKMQHCLKLHKAFRDKCENEENVLLG